MSYSTHNVAIVIHELMKQIYGIIFVIIATGTRALDDQGADSPSVIRDDQLSQSQPMQNVSSTSLTTSGAERSLAKTSSKKSTSNPKIVSSAKRSVTLVNPAAKTTYVALLSSTPAPVNNQTEANDNSDEIQPSNKTEIDFDLNNPGAVWKKALSLAANEQVEQASMYFKLHARLSAPAQPARDVSVVVVPDPNPGLSQVTKTLQMVTEGGLTFIPGAITSHTDIGFTPYFDKNLKELKGPIPLTIFNKQWQDLANSYHVEKRVKTDNIDKDTTTYTGYLYPHEMTQSYSAWNVNYRNFVTTLQEVYKFKLFATWAEAHQANVEFYHARDNWMTAFRYNIKIRMNAFAFRVSEGGISAPPNISQKHEDIAAICFAESRRLNEGSFTENPYAKGGARFGFDWTTGLPRTTNVGGSGSSNLTGTRLSSSEGGLNHTGQFYQSNQTSSSNNKRPHTRMENSNSGHRPKSGYNGKNFDPNYAAKKAASAAGKPQAGGGST